MPVKNKKPIIFSIFGASGDLAKLKIFPSIYELAYLGRLPKNFYIVGYARTKKTREKFQKEFAVSIKENSKRKIDKKILDTLFKKIHYFSGQYDQLADFDKYIEYIQKISRTKRFTNIAYFSVPPILFQDIIRNLSLSRFSANDDIRLIIEKPFGDDKESAEKLFHFVSQFFTEDQFYLLDHYLGKSSVRSVLYLRQANRILSHMMRGSEIANIQITKFEDFGVEKRLGYFEQVGLVRDMIQSHMLQLLALVTMSIPVKDNAGSLQRERSSILSAIDCPCNADNIVLGQYNGYKKQKEVKRNSKTETFAALRLFIDQQNWHDVPVYMRVGKKMNENHTYIVVELKKFPFQSRKEHPNRLIFELMPNEKLNITLMNKHEDISEYQEITTTESIACSIDGCLTEHAVLLLDVIKKEKKHFLSFAEVLASWGVVDKITKHIKRRKIKLEKYPTGSKGPKSQNKLVEKDGFAWYDIH